MAADSVYSHPRLRTGPNRPSCRAGAPRGGDSSACFAARARWRAPRPVWKARGGASSARRSLLRWRGGVARGGWLGGAAHFEPRAGGDDARRLPSKRRAWRVHALPSRRVAGSRRASVAAFTAHYVLTDREEREQAPDEWASLAHPRQKYPAKKRRGSSGASGKAADGGGGSVGWARRLEGMPRVMGDWRRAVRSHGPPRAAESTSAGLRGQRLLSPAELTVELGLGFRRVALKKALTLTPLRNRGWVWSLANCPRSLSLWRPLSKLVPTAGSSSVCRMGPPRVSWRPLFAREGPPARTVMVAARGGRAAPRSAARAEAASEAAVWNAPPPLSPLSMLRSPGCAASWGAGWRRRPTGTSRGRERPTRRCWACRSRWAVSRRGRCTRRPRPRRGAAGLARTWRCGTTSSTRAWLPGQPFSAAAAGGRSMGARAFPREARRWSSGCSRRSTKTPGTADG